MFNFQNCSFVAIIIFVACVIIMITISLFTKPVPLDALGALTWPTLNHPRYRGGRSSAEYVVNAETGFEMSNAHGAPGEGIQLDSASF